MYCVTFLVLCFQYDVLGHRLAIKCYECLVVHTRPTHIKKIYNDYWCELVCCACVVI